MRRAVPASCSVLLALATFSCAAERPASESATAPIPVEEVAAPIGAAVSTAEDKQERMRTETFSGVLPSDFPREIPLYRPATIVDYGTTAAGRSYVVLQTQDRKAQVEGRFSGLLDARGFHRAADSATMILADLVVRITFEDANPGTRIRIEYKSGPRPTGP